MSVDIGGYCSRRYRKVKDAFSKNFDRFDEIGASLTLVEQGEVVVDLWAGFRDLARTQPWTSDTVVNIWSTTKGITATCIAMLVDKGLVTYDTKISEFWPEFATNNKQDITLAMLMSHKAGLCGFTRSQELNAFYDSESAANELAQATPFWKPGEKAGYHAITIGFLADTIFRKLDGRSVKQFVRDELNQKLGLEIAIGLPHEWLDKASQVIVTQSMASEDVVSAFSDCQRAALLNPAFDPSIANSREWKEASIPSANGFATANSLARLYGGLVNQGQMEGHTLLRPEIMELATTLQFEGDDLVLGMPARWANGYLLNCHNLYGPNDSAFGHSGWGGSFAFGDPKHKIGCAYTMNHMGTELVGDPRSLALIEAIYSNW